MAHENFRQHGSVDKALAHLVEECGEVMAATGKTLRFGRNSVNPLLPPEEQETNEDWLRSEIDDLKLSIAQVEKEMGWNG